LAYGGYRGCIERVELYETIIFWMFFTDTWLVKFLPRLGWSPLNMMFLAPIDKSSDEELIFFLVYKEVLYF
jgi:hypothetical protein